MKPPRFLLTLLIPMMMPLSGYAQIESCVIKISGMGSCPACVTKVEKALRNLKVVQSVQVNLKAKTAHVVFIKKRVIRPHRLREAIEKCGFGLQDVTVTVTGRLVRLKGRTSLQVRETKQVIPLLENHQLEKLENIVKESKERPVTITGKWTEYRGRSFILVSRFSVH